MNRERGAHEDGVEMLAPNKAGILHAVSGEYIAANSRAGRNNCRGSTVKFSTAAISDDSRRRAQKTQEIGCRDGHAIGART